MTGDPTFSELDDVLTDLRASESRYSEFVRTRALSAGLYVLGPGAQDGQSPHQEDEVYVVVSGRARMTVAGETRPVGPGSVVRVAPEVEHRFHDIETELQVVVVFAPPQERVPS